jgi:TRAP-type uncharacterized transport system fused permease subunit
VPLIAVHMFVFYFGILADDTPPVGLAAYAAAAISRGDPIKTGVQGFAYDIRTALLPFMFIFNTDLLLIDPAVLGGDAGLVPDPEQALGDGGAAAHRVHAVPPGVLDGHGLSAA